AIVWNWFLSPWAFWMSNSTPAAWNASVRYLRSAVSHRAEDLLSGRMTPILPGLAAADADGASPPWAEVSPLSPPQAVRPRDSAAAPAARVKIPLRMGARVLSAVSRARRRGWGVVLLCRPNKRPVRRGPDR